MSLSKLKIGEIAELTDINIKGQIKNLLQNLGLIEGAELSIVLNSGGNFIIKVDNSRIALDGRLVDKISVKLI